MTTWHCLVSSLSSHSPLKELLSGIGRKWELWWSASLRMWPILHGFHSNLHRFLCYAHGPIIWTPSRSSFTTWLASITFALSSSPQRDGVFRRMFIMEFIFKTHTCYYMFMTEKVRSKNCALLLEWKVVRIMMVLDSEGSSSHRLGVVSKKVLASEQMSFIPIAESSIVPEEHGCLTLPKAQDEDYLLDILGLGYWHREDKDWDLELDLMFNGKPVQRTEHSADELTVACAAEGDALQCFVLVAVF